MRDPYVPIPVRIKDMVFENEARDIKTFKLAFANEEDKLGFSFLPGQFAELSLLGAGECPIGIASSPTERDYLLFTVKRAGIATTVLHRRQVGDSIGVRGPLGNTFPISAMESKNVLIVGGGFAFTTLRAMAKYILEKENRARFNELTVIYGARSPGELLYRNELSEWQGRTDLKIAVTVDKNNPEIQNPSLTTKTPRHEEEPAKSAEGTRGFQIPNSKIQNLLVGVVPAVLKQVAPSPKDTIALVCGPPVMIKYTLPVLADLGFKPESIFLSLEMRMKCGIGQCGRCNIGHKYVCKDGPVFSFAELQHLPPEY